MAEQEKEMSFLDHLEELRWHLVRSSAAVLIGAIAAFLNKYIIFDVILFGPKNPDFITYRAFCKISHLLGIGDAMCFDAPTISLINTTMSGQFSTHIYISIITGIVVAFPYIIYELWSFIKPALYEHERKNSTGIILYTSFLFLTGIAFGYFVLAPMSINFLGNYTVSQQVGDFIDLDSYISTITMVTVACGILFELPVIMYFLARVGIITAGFLRRYRRHAIVVNLLVSAIITPPDISSQIIVALPIALLYEISILIVARVEKRIENQNNLPQRS
jgi:sec-independent protein translocase protein TatC